MPNSVASAVGELQQLLRPVLGAERKQSRQNDASESSSPKPMFADFMGGMAYAPRLFSPYYVPASITIILFARSHIQSEFVTGFSLGGAVAFGCVIIGDLHRRRPAPSPSRIQTSAGGLNPPAGDKA